MVFWNNVRERHSHNSNHDTKVVMTQSRPSAVLGKRIASRAPEIGREKERASLPPFVYKLRRVVQACPPNVGQWCPDGSQFEVLDSNAFAVLVASEFKRENKEKDPFDSEPVNLTRVMQTFVRQLHFYAFKKLDVSHSVDAWAFRHPNFCRDDIERQALVKRFARASERFDGENVTTDIASARLVQVLRRKVAYLEQTVLDLKEQLANATSGTSNEDIHESSNPSKRHKANTGTIVSNNSVKTPIGFSTEFSLELDSLGSISDADMHDLEGLGDNFFHVGGEVSLKPFQNFKGELNEPIGLNEGDKQNDVTFPGQLSVHNYEGSCKALGLFQHCGFIEEYPHFTEIPGGVFHAKLNCPIAIE